MASLQAGFARAFITPTVGLPLAGTLREGSALEVERDLTVTSLVIGEGLDKLCIVALDMMLLEPEDANRIRAQIGAVLGICQSQVMVNISHTHAAPAPVTWREYNQILGDGDDSRADAVSDYYRAVWQQTLEVVILADAARQPAWMVAGSGRIRIGINRRERLRDGRMILGENPDGPVDDTVRVLRFDREDGTAIGMVMQYACHPDVLGPKSQLISPDYVGAARAAAEATTGATVMFLQGAAGDIDPVCGIVQPPDGTREMRRIGAALGCEAGRVFHSLLGRRRRERRIEWQSAQSTVTGWIYSDSPERSAVLRAISRRVQLPLKRLPSLEHASIELEERTRDVGRAAEGRTKAELLNAHRRLRWAKTQYLAVLHRQPTKMDIELQAFRIDDVVILGLPGEIFNEIGQTIVAGSAAQHTLVCGYSNGVHFYIPTAHAFAEGGYEVNSFQNFNRYSGPTAQWEKLLTTSACDCIAELFQST